MSNPSPEPKGLSAEEMQDLGRILNIRYGPYLGARRFQVRAETHAKYVEVVITLQNDQESYVYPVEGRVELTPDGVSAREGALLLIDFIGAYFEEFFDNDENTFIPIDWSEFQFESTTLFLRGQVLNKQRERDADAWLADNAASTVETPTPTVH